MKDFSVSMALVDYIPVICFAIAAVILMRDLYDKMSKGAFALFAAGTIDITCAGALKATYKLLYAAGVCDFEALNAMFFPMQSIGFLLAGIGVLAMLCHKQTKNSAFVVVPPVFSVTFVFVGLMIVGLGLMDAVRCFWVPYYCIKTGLANLNSETEKRHDRKALEHDSKTIHSNRTEYR